MTRYGAFGVDLFFGISGLLITKLLLEEWREKQLFDLPGFYIRRAFRNPAALSAVSRGVFHRKPLALARSKCSPAYSSSGTTCQRDSQTADTLHLWSLSVEEHFYLLWPGLLAWVGARKSKTLVVNLALGVALWRMVESQLPVKLLPLVATHFRTGLASGWPAVGLRVRLPSGRPGAVPEAHSPIAPPGVARHGRSAGTVHRFLF